MCSICGAAATTLTVRVASTIHELTTENVEQSALEMPIATASYSPIRAVDSHYVVKQS